MTMRGERLRVFSGTSHPRLAQDICSFMGVPLGAASLARFPDGEINLKLESLGIGDSGLLDVVFSQNYVSPDYQDTVRKRLFLLREADGLKIWKEEVLP